MVWLILCVVNVSDCVSFCSIVAKHLNRWSWFLVRGYHKGRLLCIRWVSGSTHRNGDFSRDGGLGTFLALTMLWSAIPAVAELPYWLTTTFLAKAGPLNGNQRYKHMMTTVDLYRRTLALCQQPGFPRSRSCAVCWYVLLSTDEATCACSLPVQTTEADPSPTLALHKSAATPQRSSVSTAYPHFNGLGGSPLVFFLRLLQKRTWG